MTENPIKQYPNIACCGLDCVLCPNYQSTAASKCPGCMAKYFHLKHPSCGIATCCVKKHSYETCAQCPDMPCDKLKGWDLGDSFISHKQALHNLAFIKKQGLASFLDAQKKRQDLLETLLSEFNDGRAKSFYCLAAALLPMPSIEFLLNECAADDQQGDIKDKARNMKKKIEDLGKKEKVELNLRKK